MRAGLFELEPFVLVEIICFFLVVRTVRITVDYKECIKCLLPVLT